MLSLKHNILSRGYAVLFLLFISFSLAGCGITHQTYLYHGPTAFNIDQYTGSNLSIQWQARPDRTVVGFSPMRLTLQAFLIGGPFRQIDDMLGILRKYKEDPVLAHMGSIVATAPPVQTDDWTNKPLTSTLFFPPTLQPGYYILVLMINGDPATRENAFIRIHAHT